MIKGIIFDLDGVYFKNGTKHFLENISHKFNVDMELVREVYLRSHEMGQYKKGEISGDIFWGYAIKKWGIKSTKRELLNILQEGYQINKPAADLIQKLRKKGIKSIICSNNFKERIEILEEKYNFLKDFDFVVLSYNYGILKPQLLEKVVEKTGFRPEEILVIDDGKMVIDGAKRMRFKTILCENPDNLEKYLKDAGINFWSHL